MKLRLPFNVLANLVASLCVVTTSFASPLRATDVVTALGNPYMRTDSNAYLAELAKSTDPLRNTKGLSKVKVNGNIHQISLPFKYWDMSGLGLYGLASYEKAAEILAADSKKYGTPLRKPIKVSDTQTMIFIYSANFGGSEIGALKDLFFSILLEPNEQENANKSVASVYTWLFYQNSKVNWHWKTEFWGLDNTLAQIDFSHKEGSKQASMSLPNSSGEFKEAVRMKWNIGAMNPRPTEIEFPEVVETFITRRGKIFAPFYFKGSMLVDLNPATALQDGPAKALTFFDPSRGDELVISSPEIKAQLEAISFKPSHWIMITDYSGQINFPQQPSY